MNNTTNKTQAATNGFNSGYYVDPHRIYGAGDILTTIDVEQTEITHTAQNDAITRLAEENEKLKAENKRLQTQIEYSKTLERGIQPFNISTNKYVAAFLFKIFAFFIEDFTAKKITLLFKFNGKPLSEQQVKEMERSLRQTSDAKWERLLNGELRKTREFFDDLFYTIAFKDRPFLSELQNAFSNIVHEDRKKSKEKQPKKS